MRQYRVLKNRLWRPAVNVDRLWGLVTEQHREQYQKKTEVAPVIDVVKAVSFKKLENFLILFNYCVFEGLSQSFG